MRRLLVFLGAVSLVAAAGAQNSIVTPKISQLFAFSCNSDYSSCPEGMDPTLTPVQLSDGNIYGVTWWAGQGSSNNGGTVWKVTAGGVASVVHTFAFNNLGQFPQGENPVIGFAVGADHNLYGVTESGGTTNQGVMYALTNTGTFKVTHNFCTGTCKDIQGAITLAKDGNFYGVQFGGSAIFRITPAGSYSVFHTLNAATEGAATTLIQGSDGNFYGTGYVVGETPCDRQATVFKLTRAGQFIPLTTFPARSEALGNLIQAADGNFYGTVDTNGQAQIFRMTSAGSVSVIYTLQGEDGLSVTHLLQASDKNLWVLTYDGGPTQAGAVFAVTTAGVHLTRAPFTCATTGCHPSGMIQGRDGNFYGIATVGGRAAGRNPLGTLFKMNAGLPALQ
jgi:uncharacterized repeat protein (TIGR03803 family)